jgi:hypothetical protein
MRLVRPFRLLLVAGLLGALPSCDIIAGHGNVDVVNGTQIQLTRVQLVFEGGDEEGGSLAPGGTIHFTTITAGPVTAYGYDATSGVAVAAASASLADGQTITLTLAGH